MKTLAICALVLLSFCQGFGQEARFFRLVGPAATAITSIAPDGTVTWTNAQTNVTVTIQTAQTLLGPSNWVDYVQVPISNVVTTLRLFDPAPPSGMVFIPAGSFTMGDTFSEADLRERPLHTVYVSAFYMDQYLVTKVLWDSVYQWATNNGYSFDSVGSGKASNHPVQSIDLYDCMKWSNARSQQAGVTAVYYTDAGLTQVYTNGDPNPVYANWTASGYRVPTEAEWEKAARGGLSGHRFPWGDIITETQANYYSRTNYAYDLSNTGYNPTYSSGVYPYTSPVGSFPANAYGLYDMAGNVSEWCWDETRFYSSGPQTNPRGDTLTPIYGHTCRGGSWLATARSARVAARDSYAPVEKRFYVGFRSVLPVGQ